jgi:hypothetical protein
MKQQILVLGCIVTMLSCTSNKEKVVGNELVHHSDSDIVKVEEIEDSLFDEMPSGRSLNDVRFDNWTEKEWLNNDYIKTLRNHIDACLNGGVSDEYFDKYKDEITGQFLIYSIEPYIVGGVFIRYCFADRPNVVFGTWVYSFVDEENDTVVGYECRGIEKEDFETGLTKEDIRQYLEEDESRILW